MLHAQGAKEGLIQNKRVSCRGIHWLTFSQVQRDLLCFSMFLLVFVSCLLMFLCVLVVSVSLCLFVVCVLFLCCFCVCLCFLVLFVDAGSILFLEHSQFKLVKSYLKGRRRPFVAQVRKRGVILPC